MSASFRARMGPRYGAAGRVSRLAQGAAPGDIIVPLRLVVAVTRRSTAASMDVEEHRYSEDPSRGPADARTDLPGADYFFLGNGHVLAAVQVDPSGTGTPLGLLLMRPERFGHKRAALTFDPEEGIAGTALLVETGGRVHQARPGAVLARWTDSGGVPAVAASWQDGGVQVEETFFCPDRVSPRLVREIRVRAPKPLDAVLTSGRGAAALRRPLRLEGGGPACAAIRYEIESSETGDTVRGAWSEPAAPAEDSRSFHAGLATLSFSPEQAGAPLAHLLRAARHQLPAVIAASGAVDGSIWQYNLEWARDQALEALALCQIGAIGLARTMLARLLDRFVTAEGDTVDSGRTRPPQEVELDQNGILLLALKGYTDWSGDLELARSRWARIRALADFPLRPVFRHVASGLLRNRREFWERHAAFGIEEGLELAHQLFVSVGLSCAADLAHDLGREDEAGRWREAGAKLKRAMLQDARFSLVEGGRFIKRRRLDGTVQETATLPPDSGLPPELPICRHPGPHFLDPDTSCALPIALEFVDPRGELARRTLDGMELLWNQSWEGGGYCRYNVTSEADSPGPWPFASLFVARACLEAGDDARVWRVLRWLSSLPGGARAGAWLEFYGHKPVPPCPPVGVIPWTWAEILTFFIHHLLGVRPRRHGLELRPRLLAGLDEASAALAVQGKRLRLSVRRARGAEGPSAMVNGARQALTNGRLLLPPPAGDLSVEIVTGS
ncbi:MAG: hypothetical protein HY812_20975 [Planctomycetes bacterium]|nr:hypothetical protein [Planctomycetota bacterium]